jgi:ferredoxin
MAEESRMRVRVDGERCQGHNRCYALAPDLFDVDDLGYAREIGDGQVAPDQEEQARLAAANCPEHAIELVEEVSERWSGAGVRNLERPRAVEREG